MHILLFDNQDSFTWNLAHELERVVIGVRVDVKTALELEGIEDLNNFIADYDAVVISPGPGMPKDAPMLFDVLRETIDVGIPLLGICLGMQAIVEHFNGRLENLKGVLHGRTSLMEKVGEFDLFEGVGFPCEVGHYHSWVASEKDFPKNVLQVKARNKQGLIMAISHLSLPITGFQFHPESILTPDGRLMLKNWLRINGA